MNKHRDKALHFSCYGILYFLISSLMGYYDIQLINHVFIGLIIFAFVFEILQKTNFISGESDLKDALFSVFGVFIVDLTLSIVYYNGVIANLLL